MKQSPNPFRGRPGAFPGLTEIPAPSTNVDSVEQLITRCPQHAPTPLLDHPRMAAACKVAHLHIKDERARMGLGSFKALGAAYVIARDATHGDISTTTYVTASAGNHGLSVAAGAQAFGAKAVIYLAETVPEAFAKRLQKHGAQVVRQGAIYEEAMRAAAQAAQHNGWQLLSDSSWPGYTDVPHILMEGYLMLMAEAIVAMPEAPSHIFLQAGVGGLAGACAALARYVWNDGPQIIVVEPESAAALHACIYSGDIIAAQGPASCMGRLDCKEASLIALKGLAHDADRFALITEAEGKAGAGLAAHHNLATTPSGAAGLAAAMTTDLPATARVLVILSEGAE